MHTGVWLENLKERDHLQDLDIADRMVIIKQILKK
jgi:hypothetical protein